MSGSPCFVQMTRWGRRKTERFGLSLPDEFTLLSGLVSAHISSVETIAVDQPEPTPDTFRGRLNTGVAVTPLKHLVELLKATDVVREPG